MSDYTKALEYFRKCLEIELKVLGEDHLDMVSTYSCIASVYESMEDYPNAIENYEKSLAITIINNGEDHPDVIELREKIEELKNELLKN